MPGREIRLYGIPLSHPVLAVRGMLERKGLTYRYVDLLAGTHPANLWALGFRRTTVPAMKLPDGERVQGSLAIARALEQLRPDPPLYLLLRAADRCRGGRALGRVCAAAGSPPADPLGASPSPRPAPLVSAHGWAAARPVPHCRAGRAARVLSAWGRRERATRA